MVYLRVPTKHAVNIFEVLPKNLEPFTLKQYFTGSTLIFILSLKPFLPLRVVCWIDEKLDKTNIFIF